MRVSNNNQITFGMNPKFKLSRIKDARLSRLIEDARTDILNIGNQLTECEILGDLKSAAVHVTTKLPDGRATTGIVNGVKLPRFGAVRKLVQMVRDANGVSNQLFVNISTGVVKLGQGKEALAIYPNTAAWTM